jgi:multiple sugar transport system substrate-binding protein
MASFPGDRFEDSYRRNEMSNNKLSRRDFLRAAAATGAGVAAAGALPALAQDATPTPLPLPEGSAGTLTIIHRTEYFEAIQTQWVDAVNAFAADNGLKAELSTANPEAFGDFLGKMQAAVAAGNPPDLAYQTNISNQNMAVLGIVEDVGDVVEEAQNQVGKLLTGVNADTNCTYQDVWYAVPYIGNGQGIFMRGDKLDETGMKPEDLPTWDDRRDACLAMSDPAGEFWGWGLTINQSGDGYGFLVGLIQSFGGHFTDETGTIVQFDSPETVAAVEWLAETYDRNGKYADMLPPGVESWGDISNNEAYLAGSIGYTQNAFSVYAQAKRDENPVYPVTILLTNPLGPANIDRNGGSTSGYLNIFKGAANVDAAKALALHLLSPEVFAPMASLGAGLFMPVYEDLWTGDLMASDRNFEIIRQQMSVEKAFIGTSWPAQPNPLIGAIQPTGLIEGMVANAVTGRMTPQEAVTDAHNKIVQIFEEGGAMQP